MIIAGTLALSGPVPYRPEPWVSLLDHGVLGMVVASVCSYATYLLMLSVTRPELFREAAAQGGRTLRRQRAVA